MNDATEVKAVATKTMREVATIVVFTSRTWGARVQDKKVVQQVATEAEAETPEVGTFSKKLLAGADKEFKALVAKINEARQVHYSMTLPFTRGQALLANVHMMDYMQKMSRMKAEIKQLREEFKQVYPQRVEEAVKNLGKLADRSKYPPPETIDACFGIDIEFLPIPEAEDFSYLPEGFSERLGMDMEAKLRSRTEQAKKLGWERLVEALDHAATRCLDPDVKRLYGSMIEHVLDAAKVMEGFVDKATPEASVLARVITAAETADIKKLRNSFGAREAFGKTCKTAVDDLERLGVTGE